MIKYFCLLIFLMSSISASAQSLPDPDHMSLVVAKSISAKIEQSYSSRRLEVRKLASERLGLCSALYWMLGEQNEEKAMIKDQFKIGQLAYKKAASLIHPEGVQGFVQFVDLRLRSMVEEAMNTSRTDDKSMFYLLRNCQDLGDPGKTSLAIQELLLSSKPN